MTSFPGSPRLLKGAIVALDLPNPVPTVILFQYNPETLTRRLEARGAGGEAGDRSETFRIVDPPKETITLSVEIDATDQLERADPVAARLGVHPALAALEVLLYPKSRAVVANRALAQAGNLEIIPVEAPLTLFVWGPQRVLPVRVTGFSVTEEAHDATLNPTRAKVELSLLVLNYHDLQPTHVAHGLFLAHHLAKERLAGAAVVGGAQALGLSLNIV
jgi:hypothetical protein